MTMPLPPFLSPRYRQGTFSHLQLLLVSYTLWQSLLYPAFPIGTTSAFLLCHWLLVFGLPSGQEPARACQGYLHAGYQPAPVSELPREPEGTEKSSMSLSLFSRKSCRSRFQLVTRFQLVIKTALQTKLAPILHLTSSKMTWKSLTPILRGRMGMQKVGVKGSPDRRWFCMLLVGQNWQQNYFNGFNAY